MIQKIDLSLWSKVRARGLTWFFSRLLDESNRPASKGMKLLRPLILSIYYLFLYPINKLNARLIKPETLLKKKLYLFYDLEVSPVTFDFAWALAVADCRRKKLGLESVQVVFVPGRHKGLREEDPVYETHVDFFARQWRKDALLYGLTALLPSCVGVTFCSSREEASVLCEKVRPNILPKEYSVMFPIAHSNFQSLKHGYPINSLKATQQGLRYVQQWLSTRLKKRKLIVISLRQSSYMPARNSRLEAWVKFAESLDPNVYFVVFVPDTETALDEMPEMLKPFTIFKEACWSIALRAALYETSYLNLGVNNGVMAICWLNPNCRYITFKINVESVPQSSKKALESHGFNIGKSLPFANRYQKWVWENDDVAVIQKEFKLMCSVLESKKDSEKNHEIPIF